jgi:hypothetical protein
MGNINVKVGELPNQETGFRLEDSSGTGIAQFSTFTTDNKTALRVAKPGVEVALAQPQQLSFDSSRSFTVAVSGSYTFSSVTLAAGLGENQPWVIAHNLGIIPSFDIYYPTYYIGGNTLFPNVGVDSAGNVIGIYTKASNTSIYSPQYNFNTSASPDYIQYAIGAVVDNTNLYLTQTTSNISLSTGTLPAMTVYYSIYSTSITAL